MAKKIVPKEKVSEKKIVPKEKVSEKKIVPKEQSIPDESKEEKTPAKLSHKEESKNNEMGTGVVDYLEQYQYKKVNNVPTLGGVLTNPDKGSKAERMKNFLLGQKKVSLFIPLEAGSSSKVPYSVNLNGYRLDLPTNTYIDVPEQVAEVVRDANKQTVAALNQFKQPD